MAGLPMVIYKPGAIVTIENTPNLGRFYVIIEGKARVSKNHGSIQDRKSVILGPGDAFAAVSCLSGRNEMETVQAQTDLKLLVIERGNFDKLVQQNIQFAMKISMQFINSIQLLNAAIFNISLFGKAKYEINRKDTAPRLFRVGEFYQAHSMFNQAYYAYCRCVQNYPDSPFSDTAKEAMAQIKSYVTQEKFDHPKEEFRRIYPKDAMLFAESESGKELFFILKGAVKVSRIENNKEVTLALLGSGDICGKISMLVGKPHTTNAVSLEECHTLAVGPMGLETVMKSRPWLLYRLSSKLAEQVWFLNKQIMNHSLSDPLVRLYDMLVVMLEKERVATDTHQFHFGIDELVDMAGYSEHSCDEAVKKLLSENFVSQNEKGEIRIVNIADIIRKNDVYWREPSLRPLE
ncbi:MAG: cyclic nucleotide-binding domain-containing protein [Spirochaetaceae bacterium]|nr:cyclic nucleotide-binding domain-containing protein [Spirochaetaceae bacterium]